jgi:hypothetical protein
MGRGYVNSFALELKEWGEQNGMKVWLLRLVFAKCGNDSSLLSPARRLLKAIRIIKWIADVNRISANELVMRKAKLVLTKTKS